MLTTETGGGFFNGSTIDLVNSDDNAIAHGQDGGLSLLANTDSDGNTVSVVQKGAGLLGGHSSLITLPDSDWNDIIAKQEGGGQTSTMLLTGSDGNLLTVAQSGAGNLSYIDLVSAHDNNVGHQQSGIGGNADTYLSASTYNTVAVTQGP
jgi:hypothetical protein